MKKDYLGVTLLTAGFLVFGVPAIQAQDTTPTGKAGSPDQQFMMKAAQGGMAEVQLGTLAKEHASSQAVKDFGQHMVDDHSKAGDELKSLAAQKNVTLPTEIDAKDKAVMDRLSKLNGAAFDKAYIRDMVADHRKDIAEFQKEASSGKDADAKAWAGKTLPTLQQHLQMAQSAQHQVMGGSKMNSKMDKSSKMDSTDKK